jgi:UDP-N-acetylmuramate dehydrogenase
LVKAQAGVSISDLITFCLDNNLLGLEEFSGIPGSVGGSIFINIHYFTFLLSSFLVQATIINRFTGKVDIVSPAWFEFGYNQSTLMRKEFYLVDATFALRPCSSNESWYARGRRDEIIRQRNSRYPQARTCGSFFRNFHPHELNAKAPLPYVAHYFELLGLKGKLRHGKAQVYPRHANMIVTEPGATSEDVIMVARTMQEKVHAAFDLLPEAECQFIGFKKFPLLTV